MIDTYWRKSDFFGKASLLFRYAAYIFNAIFLWIFLDARDLPLNIWHYSTALTAIFLPFILFVYYVNRNNDKGVGIRQNMMDFLMVGWYVGLIQLTYIPSSIFVLGLICNYIAARGFHKAYRLLLIGVGYALTIPVFGFQINNENIPILTNLAIIYAVVHFVTTAYISYEFSKSLQAHSRQIQLQQNEILLQSEELKTLNDSLQSLNTHLEEKVFERTKELAAKNEKLAEYTFINGHQLRGPVATMLGLVQLLDYDNTEDEKELIIYKLKNEVGLLDITIKEIKLKLETDQLINDDLRGIESVMSRI
ncbi:hypothetical protein JKA74_15255 [Marivirga sp. S37H4]|uniref:Signal transduction histidine kinase dimerisation/phosphoacceptor domain-containing protein n=1 Tax=Marivirga aurantiaca TaxID=2802615 RepID=A0A934X138_9BACT|nr:hypothetical protein [Marivirga aurantiaca]MBK6266401.1 hypothetical protein [Marivirga aurantiaca]